MMRISAVSEHVQAFTISDKCPEPFLNTKICHCFEDNLSDQVISLGLQFDNLKKYYEILWFLHVLLYCMMIWSIRTYENLLVMMACHSCAKLQHSCQ